VSGLHEVACFGECMLELQGRSFGEMRQTFGGDTLNTAVYLARCADPARLRVHYATALGDDPLSTGLLARWQAEGLATDLVQRLAGRLPGLYLIDVDPSGERHFLYWREQSAARSYFEAAITPLERALGGIDALYFSGISLAILPPAGRERLLAGAAALRARGGRVVFDNNYRPRLWPDAAAAREAFAQALAVADIALLTLDDEALRLGLAPDEALLAATLALPVPEIVVKRGAQPTLLRLAGQAVASVPTHPVDRVVDTTAAGDSFAGAYLAARLAGVPAVQAAEAGNRLAARVVQHAGAIIAPQAMADLVPSIRSPAPG
jgi:2-dehydro-3-deoxygluconokinase